MQDAVNDFSVPYHLMTREYNEAVKAALTPEGAYLLTFIDAIQDGKFWRAAVSTLRLSFKHVYLLHPQAFRESDGRYGDERGVYIVYCSDHPLNLEAIQQASEVFHERQMIPMRQLFSALPLAAPFAVVGSLFNDYRVPVWTHVLEQDELNKLLKMQSEIIFTDQYAPVDNLMLNIFRHPRRRND